MEARLLSVAGEGRDSDDDQSTSPRTELDDLDARVDAELEAVWELFQQTFGRVEEEAPRILHLPQHDT
jgi:hypothetical protein